MMYSGPASTALILRSLHGGATVGATDDEVFDNAESYRRMVCEREGVEFIPRERPSTTPAGRGSPNGESNE